jgi:formylglycine-generating enzyme required for sulfatase activity
MKHFVCLLLFALILTTAKAQSSYEEAVKLGREALAAGNVAEALKKFRMAQAFDPSRKKQADAEIDKVFAYIEKQREISRENERKARVAEEEALRLSQETEKQYNQLRESRFRLNESVNKMYDILKLNFLEAVYKYDYPNNPEHDGFSYAHRELAAMKELGIREVETQSLAVEYLIRAGERPNTAYFYVWDFILERNIDYFIQGYTYWLEDIEKVVETSSPFRIYNEKYRKSYRYGADELIFLYALADSAHIVEKLSFLTVKSIPDILGNNFFLKKYFPALTGIPGGRCRTGFNSVSHEYIPHDSETTYLFDFEVSNFNIGTYEVTNAQYALFSLMYPLAKIPKYAFNAEGDGYPICNVSWIDAIRYCNFLSKMQNKEPFYELKNKRTGARLSDTDPVYFSDGNFQITYNRAATGFRLPFELEWEYAAKGGEDYLKSPLFFSGSDNADDVAWVAENSDYLSNLVGTKKPNIFGLYDMSGNVWEWCNDWYKTEYQLPAAFVSKSVSNLPNNAVVKLDETEHNTDNSQLKVRRGGSWSRSAERSRTSMRGFSFPKEKNYSVGFRVATNAEAKKD